MKRKIRILNLYAGIGGNRKLWPDDEIEATAVEYGQTIAGIYMKFHPKDKMIVTDAHQYLLGHYQEYDFIWTSPPCPAHSRMRTLCDVQEGKEKKYPDMALYQEILFLTHFFKGLFCAENVISYYDPLIIPQKCNNHYFWCNFLISGYGSDVRGIRTEGIEYKEKRNGFIIHDLEMTESLKEKILNDCVRPEVGMHIFKMAFKERQQILCTVEDG